jgi:hypothetical protein
MPLSAVKIFHGISTYHNRRSFPGPNAMRLRVRVRLSELGTGVENKVFQIRSAVKANPIRIGIIAVQMALVLMDRCTPLPSTCTSAYRRRSQALLKGPVAFCRNAPRLIQRRAVESVRVRRRALDQPRSLDHHPIARRVWRACYIQSSRLPLRSRKGRPGEAHRAPLAIGVWSSASRLAGYRFRIAMPCAAGR